MSSTIIWFRNDLRLQDNPAWAKAMSLGQPVIPLYIHETGRRGEWKPGAASNWWQHYALKDLDEDLQTLGGRLIVRNGQPIQVIEELIQTSRVDYLFWNRRYEPAEIRADSGVKNHFKQQGLNVWSGNASLLFEPWEVATQARQPYRVYTPFRKACEQKQLENPIVPDHNRFRMARVDAALPLDSLKLLPELDWADGFTHCWTPTRRAGLSRLNRFLDQGIREYNTGRDIPSIDGTSRLSPYLHWGQIGPREVMEKVQPLVKNKGGRTFYQELVWREFGYHILYHFPETPERPLQDKYRKFPWQKNKRHLEAWQRGRTGYPIVDAGMRQLWRTGWMHNRVRMIVGSFLVKHLLQPWQAGAKWFWDCLVDADLASNTLGWQWVAGCGADAAPYFRIFNPMTQGRRFDGNGDYIREFVPELKGLPNEFIQEPWEAPSAALEQADVRLGKNYPYPIIDHKEGRERALAALASIKS